MNKSSSISTLILYSCGLHMLRTNTHSHVTYRFLGQKCTKRIRPKPPLDFTSMNTIFLTATCDFNPLNAELNPICYLLALLGAHHFLHVSRIRVKSLTPRQLMSYIYMEHLFLMFLDHTQRRTTVGRTPLDE